jgi:hypothetical protein
MPARTMQETNDAVAILKSDHDRVKELFRKYSETGERAYKTRMQIAEKVFRELEIHSALEEEIFYPAAREAGHETEEVVAEGLEEHHVVDILIQELKALTPEDETFDPKFKVLCENVEHHIEEEEGEMFPPARKALGDRMDALARQMMERKRQLLA